jgi:hypothetical protein
MPREKMGRSSAAYLPYLQSLSGQVACWCCAEPHSRSSSQRPARCASQPLVGPLISEENPSRLVLEYPPQIAPATLQIARSRRCHPAAGNANHRAEWRPIALDISRRGRGSGSRGECTGGAERSANIIIFALREACHRQHPYLSQSETERGTHHRANTPGFEGGSGHGVSTLPLSCLR